MFTCPMCSGDKRGKQGRHEQCLCVRCVEVIKSVNKKGADSVEVSVVLMR